MEVYILKISIFILISYFFRKSPTNFLFLGNLPLRLQMLTSLSNLNSLGYLRYGPYMGNPHAPGCQIWFEPIALGRPAWIGFDLT